MNQRLVGALVVGVVVGAVVGAAVAARGLFGNDTKAYFVLGGKGADGCTWLSKQDAYVFKGNKLTIEFRNFCGSEPDVSIGNFRKDEKYTFDLKDDDQCRNATVPGTDWPFRQGDDAFSNRSTKATKGAQIKLHDAKRTSAADFDVYYFDACIGGKKVDPRLVIE